MMNPEFEGDKPVNPFDLWKGANFKLRIRTVDGYPNYEQSVFESPAALSEDDEKLEAIWKKEYSLTEFTAQSNYKSYEDLKRRLDDVLAEDPAYIEFTGKSGAPKKQSTPAPTPSKTKTVEDDTPPFAVDDDDDELSDFKKLAFN
jgi:hypothetical protein